MEGAGVRFGISNNLGTSLFKIAFHYTNSIGILFKHCRTKHYVNMSFPRRRESKWDGFLLSQE